MGLRGTPRDSAESSRWNEHDEKLLSCEDNNFYQTSDFTYEDMSESDEEEWKNVEPDGDKGTIAALNHALDISYRRWCIGGGKTGLPGTREEVAPPRTYLRWCGELASFPEERLKALSEEYLKDTVIHAELLEDLRSHSIFDHIRVRNCIFHETFSRCHLPSPPGLDFECALICHYEDHDPDTSGDFDFYEGPCDELFIKTWNSYQALAFTLVNIVKNHPLEEDAATKSRSDIPDIVPATGRGPMTTFIRPADLDWRYESDDDDEDEDGIYGGYSMSECDDLLAQGVKPWDDDADAVLSALYDG